MHKILFGFFISLFIVSINAAPSCGSASCPLYINNPFLKGIFFFGLSYEYINQDEIFVGSNKSFVGAIPEEHNEVSTLNQIANFSAGYTFNDFLTFNMILPFIHREHLHIHSDDGEPERWNFSAIGDLTMLSNFSLYNDDDSRSFLNFNAGIKLPTGVTDIKNDEGEEAEVTLQPGSGSVDYLIGATYFRNLASVPVLSGTKYSELPLVLNVSYKINSKGTDDYKFGNALSIHLSTAYRFIERLSLLLQVNARFQNKADVGTTGEPKENTGNQLLFLSPGLKIHILDNLSLSSFIQIPLFQHYNGIQQAATFNLQFSVLQEIDFLD